TMISNRNAFVYNENVLHTFCNLYEPLLFLSNNRIKNFSYHRFFYNGHHLSLCNRVDWMKHYLFNMQDDGEVFPSEIKKIPKDKLSFFNWPTQQQDKILAALHAHDMWNGFSVYRRGEDFVEIWSFSSDINSEMIKNFYINQLDDIKLFIKTFCYEAKEL